MNTPPTSEGADRLPGIPHVIEDARTELGAKVAEVKKPAGQTEDEINQKGHAAADAVKHGYRPLRSERTGRAHLLGDEICAYVRENPLRAIASAAVAGSPRPGFPMNDLGPPPEPGSKAPTSPAHVIAENSAAVVAVAFATGVLCTTRPARCALRGAAQAALHLAKPALLVGGLWRMAEAIAQPTSDSSKRLNPSIP